MGIRNWLRRELVESTTTAASESRGQSFDSSVTIGVQVGADWHAGEPVKISGTTTVAADECRSLFVSQGRPEGGCIEMPATLVGEFREGRDQPVIAVHVDHARIGYLPSYLATQLNADDVAQSESDRVASVQLWGAIDSGADGHDLRAIGWVASGAGSVAWPHDDTNPAAVTILDQRAEAGKATTDMVRDALEGDDPHRAAQFRRGVVDGSSSRSANRGRTRSSCCRPSPVSGRRSRR